MDQQADNLRQQQASVAMLRSLHKAGRVSAEEVARAENRLKELMQIPADVPAHQPPRSAPVNATPTDVEGIKPVATESALTVQAELSRQADALNRQMAELSNQLHVVPPDQPCPDLTRRILALKAQIETIWDKKRYLERNGSLPDEAEDAAAAPADRPATDSEAKLALAYRKRRLIDQRSKLKRKLENPKASAVKRQEWEAELVQVNAAVLSIEDQLNTT